MAGQKELVTLVSESLGVSFESVRLMDRLLTLDGLRTPSKRGSGRTPMTFRDAANLILAAAWNRNPGDAVRYVLDYRDIEEPGKPGRTLGEGLESLLEIMALERAAFRAGEARATVTLIGPNPYAEIAIDLPGGAETHAQYGDTAAQNAQTVVRRVDLRTGALVAIAEAVARDLPGGPDHEGGQ